MDWHYGRLGRRSPRRRGDDMGAPALPRYRRAGCVTALPLAGRTGRHPGRHGGGCRRKRSTDQRLPAGAPGSQQCGNCFRLRRVAGGVAVDIYYCAPNAAGADVCWPSTPGTLLCLDDPWNKGLRRVAYTDPLPHVQPTPTPAPFALLAALGAGAMTAWSAPTVALTNPRPSSSPSHPRPARRRSTGRSSCGRSRSVHSVPATHTCHLPKRAR